MLRIDEMIVRKKKDSKLTCSKIEEIIKNKLQEVASSTEFVVKQDDMQVKLRLKTPISLQTANKIFNALLKEKVKIQKVIWKRRLKGLLKRGHLEIIVF